MKGPDRPDGDLHLAKAEEWKGSKETFIVQKCL